MSRAARHYDAVTEAWMNWVMGEDLHFGFFQTPDVPLREATRALTELLAEKAELAPDLEVLDVGCGVGTAAFHLVETEGCRVTGISTSEVGINRARERAKERGLDDRARFVLADAMDNQLPDESFDRIFSLESAHLMPDKNALFAECFRVLRPGGRVALCDVSLVGSLVSEQAEITRYVLLGHSPTVAARIRDAVQATMHRAFGSTRLTHFSVYREAAEAAGFAEPQIEDISAQTKPTLDHWGKNTSDHAEQIEALLGDRYVEDFFLALLHMSFGWGQLGGYVTMTATKPSPEAA